MVFSLDIETDLLSLRGSSPLNFDKTLDSQEDTFMAFVLLPPPPAIPAAAFIVISFLFFPLLQLPFSSKPKKSSSALIFPFLLGA